MKRFKNQILMAAAILAATVASATAQPKPALIEDVDQPGRTPYEVAVEYSSTACGSNCSNFFASGNAVLFDAPAVPAGKRLVIQHISGSVPATSPNGDLVILQSSPIINLYQKAKWLFAGPFFQYTAGFQGFSSPAFLTYGPGESPHILVAASTLSSTLTSIIISGYLIDAVN